MALSPVTVGSALAALAPFVEYLRPARSPYLLVVIFGIIGLVSSAGLFHERFWDRTEYYFLFVPLAIVLILLTVFSFMHRVQTGANLSDEDVDEQLKFSRSICISSAILCLVFGCWRVAVSLSDWVFYFHYIVCTVQIVSFTIYSAARLRYEELVTSLNHFQIALVTSAYLVAATVCVGLVEHARGFENDVFYVVRNVETGDVTSKLNYLNLFSLTALFFYGLWLWCQIYWIKRLAKIVNITVNPPE